MDDIDDQALDEDDELLKEVGTLRATISETARTGDDSNQESRRDPNRIGGRCTIPGLLQTVSTRETGSALLVSEFVMAVLTETDNSIRDFLEVSKLCESSAS
jgi:hypothetical protein